jgi:hypothetical protein
MRWLKQIHWPGFEMMGLGLALWICVLPFIGLLVVPLFGIQVGLGTGIALFIVMVVICWVLCIPAVARRFKQEIRK